MVDYKIFVLAGGPIQLKPKLLNRDLERSENLGRIGPTSRVLLAICVISQWNSRKKKRAGCFQMHVEHTR